jgi:hypothetical protein
MPLLGVARRGRDADKEPCTLLAVCAMVVLALGVTRLRVGAQETSARYPVRARTLATTGIPLNAAGASLPDVGLVSGVGEGASG